MRYGAKLALAPKKACSLNVAFRYLSPRRHRPRSSPRARLWGVKMRLQHCLLTELVPTSGHSERLPVLSLLVAFRNMGSKNHVASVDMPGQGDKRNGQTCHDSSPHLAPELPSIIKQGNRKEDPFLGDGLQIQGPLHPSICSPMAWAGTPVHACFLLPLGRKRGVNQSRLAMRAWIKPQ